MQQSPYQQVRQMGFTINRLAFQDGMELRPAVALRALDALKRTARVAQDTLKDYEMFELEEDTRAQARALPKVVRSLEKLRESLLKASEYELVGAVDVAQISAELDELMARLQ
jgi:hypothetical protein